MRDPSVLSMTPAMAAGVTKRLWEMSDVADVLEVWEGLIPVDIFEFWSSIGSTETVHPADVDVF
jgi:hypothetical protein